MTECEVAVIGGGTMGTAAAWQLAQRGRDVVLLEQFEADHVHGASHGATRNFNMAYAEPDYLELAQEARALWDDLHERTGIRVLDLVGLVNLGDQELLARKAEALTGFGIRHEWVQPSDAQSRWQGMHFDSPSLFLPDSGRVHAAEALRAMRLAAADAGATLLFEQRVTRVRIDAESQVTIDSTRGRVRARMAVVTAGAWTARLLEGLVALPTLRVSEEQPSHFAIVRQDADWPSFNHGRRADDERYRWWPASIYGMETPGEGLKVGWHNAGAATDPDARTGLDDEHLLSALRSYVRQWLPGADAAVAAPVHCTYTSTANEDFILDAVGPLVIGAGFAGHGFKFSPAIGRVLADLVAGIRPAARFRQLR